MVFHATTDAVLKWLAALLEVTVVLALVELDASDTVSVLLLMLLALAYLGAGRALERREGRRRGAWPLYATAYVCQPFACQAPVTEVEELRAQLEQQ